MHIQTGRLISIGYGRFVRSEDVVAIEPVTSGRGPRRRALVWVRNIATPLVASRSEMAIAEDMVTPDRGTARAQDLRALLRQVSNALEEEVTAA